MKRPLSSHLLVLAQLVGVAAACYPVGLTNHGVAAGLAVAVAGIALGLVTLYFNRPGNFSIYPELVPGARLVTGGPYRYVRHPMYSSLLLMMVGIALYNGRALNAAGVALVLAAVSAKALREERYLGAAFAQYRAYMRRTRRFVPFVY